MKRHRENGFTLIELMVVSTIAAVIVAVSLVAYRQGITREYALSQQARSLTMALQYVRMQALENKNTIRIVNATSFDQTGAFFRKIAFAATDHGVKVGDYVAVAGLRSAVSSDTLSAGTFYVSAATTSTFDCVYYHSDSVMVPPSPEVAVARNLTRTAQLTIQKKSFIDTVSSSEKEAFEAARSKNPQIFIYDETKYIIWDPNDVAAMIDTSASTYTPVPAFSSRGFAADETGYQLRIALIPSKTESYKIIRISPFGQVGMGRKVD
ncbi:pilus assembly FimT family protein [Desulfomonile tiedjei]|uniref:Prepilin-type N-terminal cleavage/methylation domain-containing protein n=1 Tax=Desulfomonile tiedjei (strain ATCC 49306 / DSM 6799 / DCB-1) TaxID=706587 RepID=I4C8B6_DESTA|nr:prepilin-type N-terminal cleavage/methylation domain-containing protein [Desulfomonile tiedjei]AFM25807.1 prepilin-type N-terminal cleavage/methylation domain-containing protein [Desulfomonile tiedjei DSM 6799]